MKQIIGAINVGIVTIQLSCAVVMAPGIILLEEVQHRRRSEVAA